MDVPTNRDTIDSSFGQLGGLSEQPLLHLDLEAGYWLLRNRDARALTGLASVIELHYTSFLQEPQSVAYTFNTGSGLIAFTNSPDQMNIVDLTIGLHAELAQQTLVRVGAAFPLTLEANRTFDNELQVQVERRF